MSHLPGENQISVICNSAASNSRAPIRCEIVGETMRTVHAVRLARNLLPRLAWVVRKERIAGEVAVDFGQEHELGDGEGLAIERFAADDENRIGHPPERQCTVPWRRHPPRLH